MVVVKLCLTRIHPYRVRNVVPAVLAYPSTSGGGCLLTQCDRTALFLGGCVLMTIPISEDTLLPSHTVRNVVSADCTVVIAIAIAIAIGYVCTE